MYNFIFYFAYVQHIAKDGNKGARAVGAMLVFFALLGQAFCLFVLFQYFFRKITLHNLIKQTNTPQQSIISTPIIIISVLLLMVFVYLYYNDKKIDRIKLKYGNKSKVEFCTPMNSVKVLLIHFTPWIIAIILG